MLTRNVIAQQSISITYSIEIFIKRTAGSLPSGFSIIQPQILRGET
jgi:hypothetical protein